MDFGYGPALTLVAVATLACTLAVVACAPAMSPTGPSGGSGSPGSMPATAPGATATVAPTTAWPDAIGGFEHPTSIAAPDDGSPRLFVTDQPGVVRVIRDGVLKPTSALDIRSIVGSTHTEQGLLDICFPPGYAEKRYAYLDYTDTNGDTHVVRVRTSATDPDAFDPASIQLILKVSQPYANHNGGQLAFGPDGFLYIAMGDGGSGGDPQNHGQDLHTLLGKILRIDTESTPNEPGYRIPGGNPFIGRAGALPEIWAYGLRNPWRFSFDMVTGDLWIGDVGQDKWEEVDLLTPKDAGANLGWSLYEGDHLFKATTRASGFTWPVAEYSHAEGDAVTGGYVYRGATYEGERGLYVFGDFGSGRIWTLAKEGGSWVRRLALRTPYEISTFGQDGYGELWVADWRSGTIHRLGDLGK